MRLLFTIFTLTFAFHSFEIHAQSRTNSSIPEFSFKSEKLSNATGWQLNESTEQWIENENVIHDSKCSKYRVNHVSQNFNWLQVIQMVVNGDNYYIFLYEKNSGAYKYPSIHTDWENDLKTYYFVLTPAEYTGFMSQIENKSGVTFKISSKINGYMSDRYKILKGEHLYNDENLASKINKSIKSGDGYSNECFYFNSQITDGQEIVRFLLPTSCSMDYKLDSKYFEALTSDFNSILIE
jgi:hypothetical protein